MAGHPTDQIKIRDFTDGRVTPPKRVTSPTKVSHHFFKLIKMILKKNLIEGHL